MAKFLWLTGKTKKVGLLSFEAQSKGNAIILSELPLLNEFNRNIWCWSFNLKSHVSLEIILTNTFSGWCDKEQSDWLGVPFSSFSFSSCNQSSVATLSNAATARARADLTMMMSWEIPPTLCLTINLRLKMWKMWYFVQIVRLCSNQLMHSCNYHQPPPPPLRGWMLLSSNTVQF